MRMTLLLALVLTSFHPAAGADPAPRRLEFNSERIGALGLPLPEGVKPTRRIALTADLGPMKEGKGILTLDVTEPDSYDDFGFVATPVAVREVKLDCEIKYVKSTTKIYTARVGGPGSDTYRQEQQKWDLYSITGPKITSRLFLALPVDVEWPIGRFLVQGPDAKVRHVIDLLLPPQPEPCHPGCFPAGTLVQTPDGATPIERIQVGDMVNSIAVDGRLAKATVESIFVTRNDLLEVRTTGATLVTTTTQPMALENGGFKSAGELKPRDRIWRWNGTERQVASVTEVTPANRKGQVFNLVLGVPTIFIAGDFLVRSKPPEDAVRP